MVDIDPAKYLENGFWSDLSSLSGDFGSQGQLSRISIFSLRPISEQAEPFRKHGEEVEKLQDPAQFLRAFYLWTLFDQCLHNVDIEVHAQFESRQYVPKPCGILSSYWSIFHPNDILLAATCYADCYTVEEKVYALAGHAKPVLVQRLESIIRELVTSELELVDRLLGLMAQEARNGQPSALENCRNNNQSIYHVYRRSQEIIAECLTERPCNAA